MEPPPDPSPSSALPRSPAIPNKSTSREALAKPNSDPSPTMPTENTSSPMESSATTKVSNQQDPPAPKQGIKLVPLHDCTDKSTHPATTTSASQTAPPQVQVQPVLPSNSGTDKPSNSVEITTARGDHVESDVVPDNETVLVSRIRTIGGLEISFREDDSGWLIVRVQRFV
ncbi:hypothetical protein LTR84_012252 [Exophiala bonariae]|uniref:Uncharacterized protein n=1 Tax=Exophiala bonariae TaxID=1690606 RepID=A0AAV9NI82_9EURO|nr:hypothetical protein LTR84_012252 [Exophiala bonariae]